MDQDARTAARGSLSAMVATLLACGGAGLIAGAPDWVTRIALAKTAPARSGAAPDAQGAKDAAGYRMAAAESSGSAQEPSAGAIRPPPSAADATPATEQPDFETLLADRICGGPPPLPPASDPAGDPEARAAPDQGAGTIENCSRTLEIRRATALGCAPCPTSPPGRVRASSRR